MAIPEKITFLVVSGERKIIFHHIKGKRGDRKSRQHWYTKEKHDHPTIYHGRTPTQETDARLS